MNRIAVGKPASKIPLHLQNSMIARFVKSFSRQARKRASVYGRKVDMVLRAVISKDGEAATKA